MGTETDIIPTSNLLNNRTPIEAGLSDHNMVIRGRTLFFNMMMQGRWNNKKHRYNNGFARIESDKDYQSRIKDVVRLLAETLTMNPHIMFIGLAEAPIKPSDITYMADEARKHRSLSSFLPSLKETNFTCMGIVTFINHNYFSVVSVSQNKEQIQPSLIDRVQTFKVTSKDNSEHFELVNLHLPYDIAKSKNPKRLLKFSKKLFSKRRSLPILVMGDFNIYPKEIAKRLTKVNFYVQENNNILVRTDHHGTVLRREYDTVDAIFQSTSLKEQSRTYRDAQSCPNTGVSPLIEHGFFGYKSKKDNKEEAQESNNSQALLT